MFDLDAFIGKYVTKRDRSMFLSDIDDNKEQLHRKLAGKSVLVIGGAGAIWASFLKAILPFKPKNLVVGGINEKGRSLQAAGSVCQSRYFSEKASSGRQSAKPASRSRVLKAEPSACWWSCPAHARFRLSVTRTAVPLPGRLSSISAPP